MKFKKFLFFFLLKVNPTLANEFAVAAFRFGHTLIKQRLTRSNIDNSKLDEVDLSSILFRPVEAFNAQMGGLESILAGLLNDAAMKFDTSFSDVMQNHLFEFKGVDGRNVALDLIAININRGRDHGIPSYNSFREKCGFKRAVTFSELSDNISPEQIQNLQQIYEYGFFFYFVLFA